MACAHTQMAEQAADQVPEKFVRAMMIARKPVTEYDLAIMPNLGGDVEWIKGCEDCTQSFWLRLENILNAFVSPCMSFSDLLSYVASKARGGSNTAFEEHINGCRLCQRLRKVLTEETEGGF